MRALLPIAILSFLGVAAASSAGCSASISFPTTAVAGTITGVPGSCTGQTYLVVSASDCGFANCNGSSAYALCDGTSYTECDCSEPGSGWTLSGGGGEGGAGSAGEGGSGSSGEAGSGSAGEGGSGSSGEAGSGSAGEGGSGSAGEGGSGSSGSGSSGGDGGGGGTSGGG